MKTCKVRKPAYVCRNCAEMAVSSNAMPDCKSCTDKRYDLLHLGSDFWGSYAFIQVNDKIEKVSLDRVYDIKDKE